MMQRINGAVYNWSFSDQFINESANQRSGVQLAAFQASSSVKQVMYLKAVIAACLKPQSRGFGWLGGVRLFVYSRFVLQ